MRIAEDKLSLLNELIRDINWRTATPFGHSYGQAPDRKIDQSFIYVNEYPRSINFRYYSITNKPVSCVEKRLKNRR